jgi:hypothetical protein
MEREGKHCNQAKQSDEAGFSRDGEILVVNLMPRTNYVLAVPPAYPQSRVVKKVLDALGELRATERVVLSGERYIIQSRV